MPAAKKPQPVLMDPATGEFVPIVIASRPADAEVKMVKLFEIDGRDYQVPAEPDAGLALQVIEDTAAHGEVVANMLMLKKVIGADGFQALKDCGALKGAHLAQLSEAVTKLVLGALEDDDEGNS